MSGRGMSSQKTIKTNVQVIFHFDSLFVRLTFSLFAFTSIICNVGNLFYAKYAMYLKEDAKFPWDWRELYFRQFRLKHPEGHKSRMTDAWLSRGISAQLTTSLGPDVHCEVIVAKQLVDEITHVGTRFRCASALVYPT